jgi:glycosyltransferase involved in cell wall biosynthesis
MPISACIPCRDNAATLARCLESLRAQRTEIDDLTVIDDGSQDDSPAIAERLGARVVRLGENRGRGAVRARAVAEARHDILLSCDATNALAPDFAENALRWFDDPRVAAVCGVIRGLHAETVAERWRNRHVFREDLPARTSDDALLATWGFALRRSAALAVGGFDPALRFGEDADLGRRLLQAGHRVVGDAEVVTVSLARNTIAEVLERHWRWNHTTENPRAYLREIAYACKVMARDDLSRGDWPAAVLSLLSPHYPLLRRLGFHP